MGIPILPPSVNHSYASFVPEDGKIRYGLAGIKSVGVGAADAIVAARTAGGTFKDLIDFCQRVPAQQVNKRAIEPLIRSGAMDDLGKHRGQLLNAIDFAMARAAENAKEAASGQLSLFNMMDKDSQAEVNELPDASDLSDSERLQAERDLLGIYLTGHPLHRFKNIIADFQTHSLSELVQLKDGQEGRFAAIIATVQRRISKQNKEPWAVLTADNGETMVEALVFPDAFKNYEHMCQPNLPVMLCASVNLRDGKPKLTVREIYALDEAPRRFTELVTVTVPKESATKPMIDDLHKIIAKFPGNHRLLICLEHTAGDRCIIEAGYRHTVEPSAELTSALETHLGTNRVQCIARQGICLKPRQTWRNGGAYN
jgi:DNA polymerase-3 subunit alpha